METACPCVIMSGVELSWKIQKVGLEEFWSLFKHKSGS